MSDKPQKRQKNRRASRELALKGIYRHLLNQSTLRQLVQELATEPEAERSDDAFFEQLLQGVIDEQPTLDTKIAGLVDRPLQELSPIEHGVLLIGAYELIHDVSVPYKVAINESVELAKRYGGTDGHKYVNGVLDKLAAEVRTVEINAHLSARTKPTPD